jgi:hypothetical protein
MKKLLTSITMLLCIVVSQAQNDNLNTLTKKEKKEGWELLWNGINTDGWRGAKSDAFPTKGWSITNGILKVHSNDGGESSNGGETL